MDRQSAFDRRSFLTAVTAFLPTVACSTEAHSADDAAAPKPQKPATPVKIRLVEFSDNGKKVGTVTTDKVFKSDEEWKRQLTPQQFTVARQKGTEVAFTGKYYNLHDKGIYRCVCCGNALFSSDTKFGSGSL